MKFAFQVAFVISCFLTLIFGILLMLGINDHKSALTIAYCVWSLIRIAGLVILLLQTLNGAWVDMAAIVAAIGKFK